MPIVRLTLPLLTILLGFRLGGVALRPKGTLGRADRCLFGSAALSCLIYVAYICVRYLSRT